ncbi:hypothetical protein [Listeria fleischmannii]|uniref:hypothetical protein n=1 Tax=Listeria fleischmannii TaxID=1069827 RepID=UPI001F4CE535|nr:hypothetical protein [Listeria fleischmannii]
MEVKPEMARADIEEECDVLFEIWEEKLESKKITKIIDGRQSNKILCLPSIFVLLDVSKRSVIQISTTSVRKIGCHYG